MPKGNHEFWRQKLARTKERDAAAERELVKLGWRIIRLWEHQVVESADDAAEKVAAALSPRNMAESAPIRGEPLSRTVLRYRR